MGLGSPELGSDAPHGLTPGNRPDPFAGPGEMRERCRAVDWAATPLGPVDDWSDSLRTTAGTVLACGSPMFLWWGPELVQIYNDAYRPSFGLLGRHPTALGMRGRDCWTDIWPAIAPQIAQVMSGGAPTWHEDHYLPIERNGHLEDVWWTYGYSAVRDDGGSIGGTLVVCQETTARVVAEREHARLVAALEVERSRLAYTFQNAPSFLAVLRGADHVFVQANAAYYELMGRRELLGRPVWEALPEVRGQGFEELLDGVLTTGQPYVGRAVPMTVGRTPGAPAEERFVDVTYMPLVEGDGTRAGIIAHGTDVTDHVRARREVERLLAESERSRAEVEAARERAVAASREAEEANRVKSEFLASMSHELRTPLNAIGGYAELLEMGIRGPVTEPMREDLVRIQRAQRHLLRLVNNVLNFARLESGRVEYDVVPVRLAEVVAELEPMVGPQLRAGSLQFSTDVPADCVVRADREKLVQVLLNLVSNSIKFTPAGGRVAVSCAARADGTAPAGVVHVRVSDTGVGIADGKQNAVFEPFVQVDASYTGRATGTGLGLSISRELARGMGGDLRVRSTLGEGAAFTVTLPAADGA